MCPTQSNKRTVVTTLLPSKIDSSITVGRGTDILDSSMNGLSLEYFNGKNLVIYEYLSRSQNNLQSIVSYVTNPKVIEKNFMNYTNENNLPKINECNKDSALTDHSSTENNIVFPRINVTIENSKKYIQKSNEEDIKKSGFFIRTFKKFIKNSDTLKEYVFISVCVIITIACSWNLLYR